MEELRGEEGEEGNENIKGFRSAEKRAPIVMYSNRNWKVPLVKTLSSPPRSFNHKNGRFTVQPVNESIFTRIHRLDAVMGYLEEIRGGNKSMISSAPSTPSSESMSSTSSGNSTPRSPESHYRPMDSVMAETEVKGTLVDRLSQLEVRVLKVGLQMVEEIEKERMKENEERPRSLLQSLLMAIIEQIRRWGKNVLSLFSFTMACLLCQLIYVKLFHLGYSAKKSVK